MSLIVSRFQNNNRHNFKNGLITSVKFYPMRKRLDFWDNVMSMMELECTLLFG